MTTRAADGRPFQRLAAVHEIDQPLPTAKNYLTNPKDQHQKANSYWPKHDDGDDEVVHRYPHRPRGFSGRCPAVFPRRGGGRGVSNDARRARGGASAGTAKRVSAAVISARCS